jgi:hypothetical protein
MELQCRKEGCNWTWNYKGKKHYPAYVSCPNCLSKVRLPKDEVEEAE